jgi:hypothetical protein
VPADGFVTINKMRICSSGFSRRREHHVECGSEGDFRFLVGVREHVGEGCTLGRGVMRELCTDAHTFFFLF